MGASDNGVPAGHAISLYVNNKPGVLNRIALVFSRRGFNIDSLNVSPAHDGTFSHCSIVAQGDGAMLGQIVGQLNKLVDVIHAEEHPQQQVIRRELAFIKVGCEQAEQGEVQRELQPYRSQIIDQSDTTLTFEVLGTSAEIDQAHDQLAARFRVLELVRTGSLLIAKGEVPT